MKKTHLSKVRCFWPLILPFLIASIPLPAQGQQNQGSGVRLQHDRKDRHKTSVAGAESPLVRSATPTAVTPGSGRFKPLVNAPATLLDGTFGTDGSIRNFISGGNSTSDYANAVAIQSDGKIVAAGYSRDASGNYAFALARYNTDGILDNAFGTSGCVRNSIEGGSGNYDYANAVAIQSDGKIVAVGESFDESEEDFAFALARYNTDGTLDSTFGTNGCVRNLISGGSGWYHAANSVAIQSDGKIIAAGYALDASNYYAFALARYKIDGTLDSTFGTNGSVRNLIEGGSGEEDIANSVAIQSDGKIVVAGYSNNSFGYNAFALARYKTDGTLDSTFGTNGSVRDLIEGGSGEDDEAYSVAIQSGGKIVATGYSRDASVNYAFAIARYNTDGILDNSFGTNGSLRDFISGGSGKNDRAHSVAIQSDGKIIAGGSSVGTGNTALAIARYKTDGTPDTAFGTDGSIRNFISGGDSSSDGASAVAIQSDGKIVAVGYSYDASSHTAFALARYVTYPVGISTLPATSLGYTSATVNGAVNAFGTSTTVRFLYGTTSGVYTDSVNADQVTVSADTGVSVSGQLTGLTSGTTYLYNISTTSTEGYYRGEEASFTTSDGGGSKWLSGLYFDGTSGEYAHHGSSPGDGSVISSATDNITLEAWVKWGGMSASVFQTIVSNGIAGIGGYGLYLFPTDEVSVYLCDVAWLRSDSVLPVGVWTHVAAVRNGGTWTLYQNGHAIYSDTGTPATPGGDFFIGGQTVAVGGSPALLFKGVIDEVRFSDVPRYTSDFSPPSSPFTTDAHTIALYHMDEGVGATTADASGNGYDLELVSGPTWVLDDNSVYVQATNFTARAGVNSVTLSWTTQSEVDNAGFNILRKDPGAYSFRIISSYSANSALKGLGTSSTGREYSFTDAKVKSGETYNYRIQSVSTSGGVEDISTISVTVDLPVDYVLYQNYPNPFNPSTTIRFDLRQPSEVTLEIHNALGQQVGYWNYGPMEAGRHNREIDIGGHSSGVYFYRLTAAGEDGEQFVSMKKMLMIK